MTALATAPGLEDRSSADIADRREPPRIVVVILALAIATLPLLVPVLPGNSAPVDIPILVGVAVTAGWLVRERLQIRLPYLLGMGLLLLGGSLAALVRGEGTTILAMSQDLLVFAWGAALANVLRHPRAARALIGTWCWSALAWATAIELATLVGFSPLSGIRADNAGRVQGTLGDPNLAADYFLISLFVVLACHRPRSPRLRFLTAAVLLLAAALTGSNGGLVSTGVAVVVSAVAWLWRARGPVTAISVVAAGICVLAVIVPAINLVSVEQRAAVASPLLQDSLGRGGESSGSRSTLFHETSALYEQAGLLGIGPDETKTWLTNNFAPYVKEAHSDYTASLVERGIIGAFGLLLLLGSVLRRGGALLLGPVRREYAALVPSPQMLLGALSIVLVSSAFYEVLHFRHVWALFGLVAGLQIWGRARSRVQT